jgi:1-acyl-sn-glycerol-3-phosphate acyltransferase
MSKNSTKIHKFNIFYNLLKFYQLLVFHLYYGKVKVMGRKNIPYGSPIIFTPNHQNALMDALIVLNTARLSPVFMARADIFKKKTQEKILNFLKILPVYRKRDGTEELSKNEDIFNICLDILRDCSSVCLMPEGDHGHHRRLRPLVKGTFRIAFRAQEEFGDKNSVKIVPVGIDFGDYQKIQTDLLVIYGKPIEVSEYMEAYRENQPRAINAIKDKLSDELKKIIIHIGNTEHYDMYQDLRCIYNNRMRGLAGIRGNSLYKRFQADKQMISLMDQGFTTNPELMLQLSKHVAEYMAGLQELNLRDWVIDRKGFSVMRTILQLLLLIVTSPIFIMGWIANIIPYTIPQIMIRNVKDPQFISSFRYVVALLLFFFYYAIAGTLTGIFTNSGWILWPIMAGMLVSGYIALFYSFSIKKLFAAVRFRLLKGKGDQRIIRLIELHEEIINMMNSITGQFKKSDISKE